MLREKLKSIRELKDRKGITIYDQSEVDMGDLTQWILIGTLGLLAIGLVFWKV